MLIGLLRARAKARPGFLSIHNMVGIMTCSEMFTVITSKLKST